MPPPERPPVDESLPARCPRCGKLLPDRRERCPFCVRYRETFGRIAAFLRPYRVRVALVVGATLITTGLQLIPPLLTRRLVDDVLPHAKIAELGIIVLILLATQLASATLLIASGAALAWLGGRVGTDLRSRVFAAVSRLEVSYFDKRQTGQVFSRVMNDTSQLQTFLVEGLPYFFQNALLLFGVLAVLLSLAPFLTLFVLLPVPLVLAAQYLYWRSVRALFHKWWNQLSRLQSRLMESLSGARVVKAFAQEGREAGDFDAQNKRLFLAQFAADRIGALFQPGMHFLLGTGILFAWYFGGQGVAGGKTTLGTLIAFVAYLWMFYGPLQWFTQVNNWMTRAFAGAERVFETLDAIPESYDPPGAVPLTNVRGKIELRDVSFSYEKDKTALKGVTLTVRPGERIGLVGRSGSGKSTLLALLARFYEPNEGTILLDGVPLAKLKLNDLRRATGWVAQDPFLFGTSIAENIRFGRPKAGDAEIVAAARAADAHAFILSKPDAYDTRVGERGSRMSGGERQRIAIARALLADPAILLLDEATSSVDSETEARIQASLERLMHGRTTLIAAHRLSTLRAVDRVAVLERGKLVELGSHEELMRKKGRYHRLVRAQERMWKRSKRDLSLDGPAPARASRPLAEAA